MKRTTVAACLAAVMLLAMAVPAFATPDGSSATVYGKAVLAPYAVVITGGGTDPGSPLTYEGALGTRAEEKFGSVVTIENAGTEASQVKLDVNQLPTDGSDVWSLRANNGPGQAGWEFYDFQGHGGIVVPTDDPHYSDYSALDRNLDSGGSITLGSFFDFPTSTGSSADHYMSATISVQALPQ